MSAQDPTRLGPGHRLVHEPREQGPDHFSLASVTVVDFDTLELHHAHHWLPIRIEGLHDSEGPYAVPLPDGEPIRLDSNSVLRWPKAGAE